MRPSRLRRSELSTPGSNAKMIAKAVASAADFVFLDLEDAVAPAAKEGARANLISAFNELDWQGKVRACRINGVHTSWCYDDVISVVSGAGENLDVIILPKVRSPREVWFVDDLLTQIEMKHGLEPGRIGLEVLIEEAEAVTRVDEIASSSDRLEALILGVGDLAGSQGMRGADIGAGPSSQDGANPYPGDMWHYARIRMILAARANGLDALDGPYGDFQNDDGYREQATWASTLGAVGKWCIHPNQISVANEVFAPTKAEIEHARAVVDAVARAESDGLGAAQVDGMMVDAASTRIFAAVLERAALCGVL